MPELSREAMTLMELSPVWRLRASLSGQGANEGRAGLMIAALAQDPAAQRLWAAIAKAMLGLGYDSIAVQGALIMQTPIADRIASELGSRKPATLLSFGEELAETLKRTLADADAGTTIQSLPSLKAMTSPSGSANAKRQLWSLLVAYRKS